MTRADPEARPRGGAAAADAFAPLFVVSFPRSGTTLLRAMLHSHPDLAVLPEPWWMVRLMKALRSDRRQLTRERAAGHLEAQISPLWLAGAGMDLGLVLTALPHGLLSRADIVSAVGKAYTHRFGKARWGVKHPGAEFRRSLRLLHEYYPQGVFIFLARDARDVYLSQMAAGLRAGTRDLYLFCFLWAVQTRRILRDFARIGDHALVVRYEDLVENPRRVLADLCEAAALPSSASILDQMLDYSGKVQDRILQNPIHRNLGSPVLSENRRKFVGRLTPSQIRGTELLIRGVQRRLGYPSMETPFRLRDMLAVAAQVPWRLAVNVVRNGRGRSTLSGMQPGKH